MGKILENLNLVLLIGLVAAVDGICQAQARSDAEYFVDAAGRAFDDDQRQAIHATTLSAYRWQYIASGVQDPRYLVCSAR